MSGVKQPMIALMEKGYTSSQLDTIYPSYVRSIGFFSFTGACQRSCFGNSVCSPLITALFLLPQNVLRVLPSADHLHAAFFDKAPQYP